MDRPTGSSKSPSHVRRGETDAIHDWLWRAHNRQIDETRLAGGVIDPLYGFPVIIRSGSEHVLYECLRIAVAEGEPAR